MKKDKKKPNVFLNILKVAFIILFAVSLAAYAAIKMYLAGLQPIPNFDNYTRNIVTQVYSSDERIIKTFQTFRYEQVTIDEIPQQIKDAIISTEDKNFYSHEGYDIFGIVRSMLVNIVNKRAKQGASTITQQLARVLFLSNEKTFARKIKEIQVAARIEKSASKDKILEMYLNNVYLGSGAYGVGAAASTYFDKDLSKLTLAECALLAGLPQAPSIYSPFRSIDRAEKRRNQVLKRMYVMRKITKKEYDEAKKEKIVLSKKQGYTSTNIAPYFIDYVLKEIEALGFDETEILNGGYKITTTLDYDAQIAANEAINKNMAKYGLTKPKQNAALFAFSPTTGAIIAYCGGKNYVQSQYDRVTQAVRPPGSSFKPIVYAAAVHRGWMPNDIVEDTPITIGNWSPHNYGNKYRGKMPLYKALAISSNVVAVRLIQAVGIGPVLDMARSLGITTPLTYDYTIALGSNGVKLYDMVIVYGAFANGGYRVMPYAVEKIETQRGKVIYEAKRTKISKVLDKDTAGIMTAMLKKVIKNGTGRGADINKPMAGKTGTTNQNKDAWFIGYTPDIVTGVFIGNDDNKTIGLTGGTGPASIWKDMMLVATKKYGENEFDYDDYSFITYEDNPAADAAAEEDGTTLNEPQQETKHDNVKNEQNKEVQQKVNTQAPKPDADNFKSIPVQLSIPIGGNYINKTLQKEDQSPD